VRSHWRAEQHLLEHDARLVPEIGLPGSAFDASAGPAGQWSAARWIPGEPAARVRTG
jgi:hypothetical protein